MAFHEVNYDVYVALGDPELDPLWTWDAWEAFYPALDPLMNAARRAGAVRSNQYLPEGGPVKFGKMTWSDEDHEAWVHSSPFNTGESELWVFGNMEAWAPIWTVCEQEDQAPDVFFSISNELNGRATRYTPRFNPLVILAVEAKLAGQKKTLVKKALKALQKSLKPKLFAHSTRPWGYGDADGFSDAMNDLSGNGLFTSENPHGKELSFEALKGKWEKVE